MTADDGGVTGPPEDAAAAPDANGNSLGVVEPALVFVNGLVNGAAPGVKLGDVRICIPNVTGYPLPDDRAMPLANYPGIAVGQGVDLGAIPLLTSSPDVTIDVFNATDLQADAAWESKRTDCASITCTNGAACRPHAELHVPLAAAINLVVLRDDAQSGVALAAGTLDPQFSGAPGTVRVQVANFSGWHAADPLEADYGPADHSTTFEILASGLGSDTASVTASIAPPTYEDYGVWLRAPNSESFGQSLGSVQWTSDPTTAPEPFFEVRKNFAFVLVGDATNTTLDVNGRDPSFDGKALHFVAVPFAAGVGTK